MGQFYQLTDDRSIKAGPSIFLTSGFKDHNALSYLYNENCAMPGSKRLLPINIKLLGSSGGVTFSK